MPPLNLVVPPAERRRRIPPLRSGVYILPNLFTTGGLVAGFYSIICTHNAALSASNKTWFTWAAGMILVAQLCDMLDGRVARLTRSTSSFGVQYDSLADLIAFGVAPGFLVYTWALTPWGRWGWLAATLYVVCAALRLARFNVQVATVEKRHFLGLPSPAAADVIASTVLLFYYLRGQGTPAKHVTMLVVIFAVAGLMVSEIRYFSFKEFHIHRRHPFPVLLALIVIVLLTIGAPEPMLFLGTSGFALSGPVGALWRLVTIRRRRAAGGPPGAATATDVRA
ncbi:MAG: CDP-diacylglycerol--serine O-phosphatidyltransferase [Candidatus Binatia bacterium]